MKKYFKWILIVAAVASTVWYFFKKKKDAVPAIPTLGNPKVDAGNLQVIPDLVGAGIAQLDAAAAQPNVVYDGTSEALKQAALNLTPDAQLDWPAYKRPPELDKNVAYNEFANPQNLNYVAQ